MNLSMLLALRLLLVLRFKMVSIWVENFCNRKLGILRLHTENYGMVNSLNAFLI